MLGCTYGIGTKPLHQIEVAYQSDVIKASTSDLLVAKTLRHSNDTYILANTLSVVGGDLSSIVGVFQSQKVERVCWKIFLANNLSSIGETSVV